MKYPATNHVKDTFSTSTLFVILLVTLFCYFTCTDKPVAPNYYQPLFSFQRTRTTPTPTDISSCNKHRTAAAGKCRQIAAGGRACIGNNGWRGTKESTINRATLPSVWRLTPSNSRFPAFLKTNARFSPREGCSPSNNEKIFLVGFQFRITRTSVFCGYRNLFLHLSIHLLLILWKVNSTEEETIA